MKVKSINSIFWILYLIYFCGCVNSHNSQNNKNLATGDPVRRVLNGVNYDCRIIKDNPSSIGTETIDCVQGSNRNFDYQYVTVVLTISDHLKESAIVHGLVFDSKKYNELMYYANTELANDFSLMLDQGQLISCSLVHLEPANSIKPEIRVVACFKVPNTEKSYTMIFNDNIFNRGPIKFNYFL